MSDRPVSLRAVLSEPAMVDAIPVDEHSRIADRLRALPTFAPATPDALTIPDHFDGQSPTHWVTLLLGHNPLLGAIYDYACAVEKGAPEAVIVNRRDRLIAVADTFATAPTKPPREMPTPQPGMVVALVSGDEFYIPHNQYTTWRSVVSCLAPAALRASESSIVRIYWPGPTPVVIWERA